MFHFGGSLSALVFRASSDVKIHNTYKVPDVALKINHRLDIPNISPFMPPGRTGYV